MNISLLKPSEVTYRFTDKSCGRTACENPANSGCQNLATGWFYCRSCASRIQTENPEGPEFMLIGEGEDAYPTPEPKARTNPYVSDVLDTLRSFVEKGDNPELAAKIREHFPEAFDE